MINFTGEWRGGGVILVFELVELNSNWGSLFIDLKQSEIGERDLDSFKKAFSLFVEVFLFNGMPSLSEHTVDSIIGIYYN